MKKARKEQKYVWYASYGSNLLKERFLCYIVGGNPIGANRKYDGCTDKSFPKADKKITIDRELYFAKESGNWENMAVCFITQKSYEKAKTLGRMYLITQEQFIDVLKQENKYSDNIWIDFDVAKRKGFWKFTEWNWYNKMIYLGSQSGFPIFTFTHSAVFKPYNRPGSKYLKTMYNGIKQAYKMKKASIISYLLSKNGIKRKLNKEELIGLFK